MNFVLLFSQAGYEVLMCDFHVPHMKMDDRVVQVTLPFFLGIINFFCLQKQIRGF